MNKTTRDIGKSKHRQPKSILKKCEAKNFTRPDYRELCNRIRTRKEVWDGYTRFRIGDIVRITDIDDNKDYFAQISALLVNKYVQRSAMIIWLVPKLGVVFDDHKKFDPNCYEPAIAEECPIPLNTCEFECHCPSFAPYKKEWTPDDFLRDQIRKEICQRIDSTNSLR